MLAYLQLLRLPTIFTAIADVLLGFYLTHRGMAGAEGAFLGLLGATVCLYFSGMVFNDYYDVAQDRAERPGRPIPSGRVSARSALTLGLILQVLGVLSAASVGQTSLLFAVLLVVAIHAYDGLLKRTPLGPLAMGTCRFLNVLLAASHAASFQEVWQNPQLACAASLGLYIVGVTWFARTEAKDSARGQLVAALVTIDLGLAGLAALIATWVNVGDGTFSLLMLAFVALTINRRVLAAVWNPHPRMVQMGVKILLLSYIMLCATLVYWHLGGGFEPLMTALLVVPALLLSRVIPMT